MHAVPMTSAPDRIVGEVPIGTRERVLHALLFEALLLFGEFAVASAVSDRGAGAVSLLVVALALLALAWTYLFNVLFDRVFGQDRLARGVALRIAHGACFELVLVLASWPIVRYALDLGWGEALALGAGFSLFALLFVLVYNWAFDRVRVRMVGPYPTRWRTLPATT